MRSILGFAGVGCLAAAAAAAELAGLPTDGTGWFGDPTVWRFREDGIHVTASNGFGLAVYEAAPCASNVTVEACFTPLRAAGNGWNIASVALVEDARNYWHLALVQTPPEQGCRPAVELCEMRDGEWLAQGNLRLEIDEAPAVPWVFGQPHRLTLSLDAAGVTGTLLAPDGRLLLRRRFAFSAPAVRRGRPAVRVGGFAGTFSALRAAWSQPAVEPAAAPPVPPYAPASGGRADVTEAATGFFRVAQKPDGRWWAIDPHGRGVVLLGVDHVTFHGHWCEKLGYAPHGRKNEGKYASRAEWEEETLARLKKWGFNMLGAGCDPRLKHRGLVHTEFLNIGDHLATLGDEYEITPNERRPCSSFPNVFHPDFEAYCRYVARARCVPCRDDPWLFGYFIDNELAWWGRGPLPTGLFDAVMKKGPEHTAKRALRDFLSGRAGQDIAAFNARWGVSLNTFDDLLPLRALPSATEAQREAKRDFLRLAADRYFAAASRAIREADPNHLVLGARFAGTGGADPAVWEVAGRYCDVVTFNSYPMADLNEGRVYTHLGKGREAVADHFATYYGYVRRPMLITEWSFPALDAGLPSVHGAGQRFRTQAERTQATSLFARTMLSLPFLLGYDYFMWVDEPALGISTPFPEDSNYGLINEDGVPYPQLTAMFEELHREAGKWRRAPAPEPRALARQPPTPPQAAAQRLALADAAGAAFFTREGDAYRAGNSRLALSGRLGDGPLVPQVALDGRAPGLGAYNALLHTEGADGQSRWSDVLRVTAVEGRVKHGVAVVELTGVGGQGGDRFEVTHRLLLPEGRPWFVCEWVGVRNIGSVPLRLKGAFFRLYSPFKGTPALPPNLWGMPESDCWLDRESGRFLGLVAPRTSGVRIDFWLDEQGGPHPDARFELDGVDVAPGATYVPGEPVLVIGVAGEGGDEAWLEAAQTAGRLVH